LSRFKLLALGIKRAVLLSLSVWNGATEGGREKRRANERKSIDYSQINFQPAKTVPKKKSGWVVLIRRLLFISSKKNRIQRRKFLQ